MKQIHVMYRAEFVGPENWLRITNLYRAGTDAIARSIADAAAPAEYKLDRLIKCWKSRRGDWTPVVKLFDAETS